MPLPTKVRQTGKIFPLLLPLATPLPSHPGCEGFFMPRAHLVTIRVFPRVDHEETEVI